MGRPNGYLNLFETVINFANFKNKSKMGLYFVYFIDNAYKQINSLYFQILIFMLRMGIFQTMKPNASKVI